MSEPFLSEEQARRLWERAAALQAEAARRREAQEKQAETESGGRLLKGAGEEEAGYSLAHIREAGLEAGIQPDYLDFALAEEAILELEGGSDSGWWDRLADGFLGEWERTMEIERPFPFPSPRVWTALEEALTSEEQGLDLLDTWGGSPAEGGVAIFEAPYSYEDRGSLKYWSTVAEVRRYMVRVQPVGEDECLVLVRAPLRRTYRIHAGIGVALSGIGGALGGSIGLGLTAALAVAWGWTGVPLAVAGAGLIGGGTVVSERLTRIGSIKTYRWGLRSLERALRKILERLERELRRTIPPGPSPD